ncbi:hypothetical protein GGH96_001956 [Coemansia sp. RSA 1972]|nr:hypothetical protein GGH96_001956 [Coemansia sp. RSA 1972]
MQDFVPSTAPVTLQECVPCASVEPVHGTTPSTTRSTLVQDPSPSINSMQDLITQLNTCMGDSGLGSDPHTVRRVRQLMHSYTGSSSDWSQYAIYTPGSRYTRNLVDDGNGKYNLLMLVWGADQESPIHDHANSHCMMRLLEGQLDEALYKWPQETQAPRLVCTRPLREESVAYMHDRIGLHRISNPSETRRAVSLHLYSPPYDMCKTFDARTGHVEASSCTAERLHTPHSQAPGSITLI